MGGFLSAVVFFIWVGTVWGGPSASITDTATPPAIDGDLSDWTIPPTLRLDKKENVVIGVENWEGPQSAGAVVYVTYDKEKLYIAADITSQTPQFNPHEGRNLYNGDALEIYVGTDHSDPTRKSYLPTDFQIGLSPGVEGEGAEVFSFTDSGRIPDAVIATQKTDKGYTLEAAIPLIYFYKIHVAPGKKIGFDVALDDVGPGGKARTFQLTWSGKSDSWQNPSSWGELAFTGKTEFENTAPKQAMPGATSGETAPEAGRKNARTDGVLLWGFNGDTGGFLGKTKVAADIASEGTGALEIEIEGSQGWNQNLAATSEVPRTEEWEKFKSLSLDAYFPEGSFGGGTWCEIYLVIQSQANNWYQVKMDMKQGWNHVEKEVDASQLKGVFKVYIVLNSPAPLKGRLIVDNIRGHLRGAPGKVEGSVQDASGKPVAGAFVILHKTVVETGPDGKFQLEVPSDTYQGEVIAPDYQTYTKRVSVSGGGVTRWDVTLKPLAGKIQDAVVDVFFDRKIRRFDPHYIYGNNIAPWQPVKGFRDEAALAKIRKITSYIRIPGGGYANVWNWKTAEVYQKDAKSVEWVTDVKWEHMANFIKSLGPDAEALLTANLMTMPVEDTLAWIADIKKRGIKLRYVEMGNEPDYEAELSYKGQKEYWTVIANYAEHYLEFARAIKAQYPELKLMGPTPAQVENRQRKEGSPWLAPADAPWWVEEFLKLCAPYVDVVSVHSYPYWSNDSDRNLLNSTKLWSEWVPKIRAAVKKYIPDRADKIEIAVTEWNSGVENATTAKLVNGVFAAEYLAQMILWGVNQTNIWDMYTQKPGQGGGHGVLNPDSDPPYEERAAYWALYLMRQYFGDTLYRAASNAPSLSVYAAAKGPKKTLLVVNKSSETAYRAAVNLGAGGGKHQVERYTVGPGQYRWSENLYKAVLNTGPKHVKTAQAVGSRFEALFPPYSITVLVLTPQ